MHWLAGLLLLVCFVIPGILYIVIMNGKEDTLLLTARPGARGTNVQVVAHGTQARLAIKPLQRALGVAM